MGKKYHEKNYDRKTYKNIYDLYKKGKYLRAKKYLFEYLEKYPQSIEAKSLLSRILIMLQEYDEAEKLLNYCIEKHSQHIVFLHELLILYMEKEEYEKAYECHKKIDLNKYNKLKKLSTTRLSTINALLCSKLNIPYQEDQKDRYIINQYKKYDEEKAIKHIQERHYLNINENLETNDYYFYEPEQIREIFEKVTKNIEEKAQKEPRLDVVDYYYFYEENIGKSTSGYTDILKVVTIKNSNKIITMYPVKNGNIDIINELEERKEYSSGKIKQRKSQIDKFYEKYK